MKLKEEFEEGERSQAGRGDSSNYSGFDVGRKSSRGADEKIKTTDQAQPENHVVS
jgi:hypothetical protein